MGHRADQLRAGAVLYELSDLVEAAEELARRARSANAPLAADFFLCASELLQEERTERGRVLSRAARLVLTVSTS